MMVGPNEEFVLHGYHQLKAWINGASMAGVKEGKCSIKFKDGVEFDYICPQMNVEKVLSNTCKTQMFYKYAFVRDLTNGIDSEILLNPNFDSSVKGLAARYTVGWFKSTLKDNQKSNRKSRGDDFHIQIIKRKMRTND
mmetsp:Transcript_7452/g.12599  ORF Transcript_7452/g.12599 Transcript_7452/m.12599 type:complete len:138 (+) Transcript_7452:484-897(+)